jgi:UDP-galactopyranose mutase
MIDTANQHDGRVEVKLSTNWFDVSEDLKQANPDAKIIYTGPIDEYYDYKFGALNWRSLDLKQEVLEVDDFQGCPVMNYADLDAPYTRIHEFKHFHPERKYERAAGKTVIVREYSKTWQRGDEPYYPVNTAEDLAKLKQYQELAEQDSQVVFGGRLGAYKYFDMDATFAHALDLADQLLG